MPTVAKKATRVDAHPDTVSHLANVTDRMHALLMDRADALMGCTRTARKRPDHLKPAIRVSTELKGRVLTRLLISS